MIQKKLKTNLTSKWKWWFNDSRVNPSNANLQYNDLIIRERHEDILALSTEMNQVQTVFKDLAEMIADQGEMIEDIESNVTSAAEQSKQGVRQIMVLK